MLEIINKQSMFFDDYIASNFQNTWFDLLLTIKYNNKNCNITKREKKEETISAEKNNSQGYKPKYQKDYRKQFTQLTQIV